MVNNPQMVDLQKLTAEQLHQAETGIRVNFTVLPENDVRDKISQEFSSQAGQYDVATLSNFEIPIYAKAKWIAPLDDYIAKDTGVRPGRHPQADDRRRCPSDGKVYGEPFYGESSFLMYRKDVLDAEGHHDARRSRRGRRSPTSRPRSTAPQPGMKGICLRGQPGWGQVFAPLTTVVNTFGGTWFDEGLDAGGRTPAEFTEATQVLRRPRPRARRERAPRRPASPSA